MTTMRFGGYTENFTYNVRGQLTNLTATGNGLASVNLQYKFAAFPNNDGRLTQMEDAVSGEETNYMYDSLGRLTDAHTTGAQWGQTFSYDGFGNLTAETATKGPAPSVTRTYDPGTNRLTGTGYAYDANGNMTAMPGLTMTYSVENRLTQAVNTNFNETDNYGYDPAGLRLWKQSMTDSIIHVYYNGLDGKPLADFYLSSGSVQGGTPMVYFAGKRVDNGSVDDRLGTAVVEGGTNRMAYFPYGELRSGTSTELQYATYKRDSTTNLDYAQHRYYSSQIVRFLTPDPYDGSMDPEAPQSFNRYAYVAGDPANGNDPSGLVIPGWGQTWRNWINEALFWGNLFSQWPQYYLPDPPVDKNWDKALTTLRAGWKKMQSVLQGQLGGPCQDDLNKLSSLGVTAQGILANGGEDHWQDALGNTDLYWQTMTPADTGYSTVAKNMTVGMDFKASKNLGALTASPGSPLAGNIYFSPSVKNLSPADAAGLLMHEAIHTLTPVDDTAIQAALFGANSPKVGAPSQNINDQFAHDCFGAPTSKLLTPGQPMQ